MIFQINGWYPVKDNQRHKEKKIEKTLCSRPSSNSHALVSKLELSYTEYETGEGD